MAGRRPIMVRSRTIELFQTSETLECVFDASMVTLCLR
jgi:hypothetical protein